MSTTFNDSFLCSALEEYICKANAEYLKLKKPLDNVPNECVNNKDSNVNRNKTSLKGMHVNYNINQPIPELSIVDDSVTDFSDKCVTTTQNYSSAVPEKPKEDLTMDNLSDSSLLTMQDKLLLSSWDLPDYILKNYKEMGITQMFQWQVDCLCTKGILNGKNLVYSAPTSAGKTLVAELILLKRVIETGKKGIFILPFVSVAREKTQYFQSLFSEGGIRVEGFMGSQSPPGGFQATDIAICTIEKANNLINRLMEEKKTETLGIIIVDELHMVGDPHRGYLLELMLTKLRYLCSTEEATKIQIVGMSATLPNLDVLAKWLNAELYATSFRPIPLMEMVKIGKTLYDNKFNTIKNINTELSIKGDNDNIVNLCLETVLEGFSVLIFCPTKAWVEKVALLVAESFFNIGKKGSLYPLKLGEDLRRRLDGQAYARIIEALKKCPAGLDSVLSKSVAFGAAFHHAGLTFDERDIIEGAFRAGYLPVLVATSTLSSGVNLPARRVIIRSPNSGGKTMEIQTYKQMVGRAGRKGKDLRGESILMCSTNERHKAEHLFMSQLPPIASCMQLNSSLSSSLKRAILEIIVGGVANSQSDIDNYCNCSFLIASLPDLNEEILASPSSQLSIRDCLDFLFENELIRTESKVGMVSYIGSQLGQAVLASGLSPDEGIHVYSELHRARQCFVLQNELHVVYQVTPIYVSDSWPNMDWLTYLEIWESLPSDMKKVGELVGIEESFIIRCMKGSVNLKVNKNRKQIAIHLRFYAALALLDLVHEIPLSTVVNKYNATKGLLQALQQSASTFAGMVTVFCNRLGWHHLELLISQYQNRLQFGIQRDLCDLVRLSLLNGERARFLFNAGLETVVKVANSDALHLEWILRKSLPFLSIKDESEGIGIIWSPAGEPLTLAQASERIVLEARHLMEKEVGVNNINWDLKQVGVTSKVDETFSKIITKESPLKESESTKMETETPQNEEKNPVDFKILQTKDINALIINEINKQDVNLPFLEKENEVKHLSTENVENSQRYSTKQLPKCEILFDSSKFTKVPKKNSNFSTFKMKSDLSHQTSTPNNNFTVPLSFNYLNMPARKSVSIGSTYSDDDLFDSSDHNNDKIHPNKNNIYPACAEELDIDLDSSNEHLTLKLSADTDSIGEEIATESGMVSLTHESIDKALNSPVNYNSLLSDSVLNEVLGTWDVDSDGKQSPQVKKKVYSIDNLSSPLLTPNTEALLVGDVKRKSKSSISRSDFKISNFKLNVNHSPENVIRRSSSECNITKQDEFLNKIPSEDLSSSLIMSQNFEQNITNSFTEADVSADNSSKDNSDSVNKSITESPSGRSLSIIDVTSDKALFHTFLKEWSCQRIFSLSLACETGPVQTKVGIGWRICGRNSRQRKASPQNPITGLCIDNSAMLLVGIAVCWGETDAYYINLRTVQEEALSSTYPTPPLSKCVFFEDRIEAIKKRLSMDNYVLRTWDAKTCVSLLLRCGLLGRIKPSMEDPSIAAWMLNPSSKPKNLHNTTVNYDASLLYLLSDVNKCEGFGSLGIDPQNPRSARFRAATESVVVFKLTEGLSNQLDRAGMLHIWKDIEMPSIYSLACMEVSGIGFSNIQFEEQKKIMMMRLKNLEKEAYHIVGRTFSLGSLNEVAKIIYLELRLAEQSNSKSIGRTYTRGSKIRCGPVNKETLEKLKNLHPLPAIILEWRKISFALNKTLLPIQNERKPCTVLNMDRIHPVCHGFTATGRITFHEPNLQTIPKDFEVSLPIDLVESRKNIKQAKIMLQLAPLLTEESSGHVVSLRHAFVAGKDRLLLAADYNQLELRLLAHLSAEENLLSLLNKGNDIFISVAAEIHSISPEDVNPALRQQAKQICYGVIYGIGVKSLSEQLGVEEKKASEFVENFYKKFPRIRKFTETTIEGAQKCNFVTTMQGRKRYLEDINSESTYLRAQCYRQAVNTRIQGSAADLVKKAMVHIDAALKQNFPDASAVLTITSKDESLRGGYLVHQLHDELIYEVLNEDIIQVAEIVKENMENVWHLSVALPVKVKVGPSWGSLQTLNL